MDDAIDNPGDQRTATIRHAVSGADYGLVSADSISITVEDDDSAPGGITLSASPDTVTENGGDQTVTITASTNGGAYATTTTITVEVGKSGDTAVAGSDYTEVDDQTITISAGATSGRVEFTLTPTDDPLDEADESISINGSVTRDSSITVTGTAIAITDDDAEPTLSVADAAPVTEGHDLTTTDMSFEVTLSEASGKNITAPYTIESGSTATVGSDYTDPDTKSVVIAAGATSSSIVIEVKGDRVDEDNETIAIKLGDPTNAALSTTTADITASGTITDDDTRGVTVSEATLSVDEADSGGGENKTTYTVLLDSQPTGLVTVSLTLSPATGVVTVDTTTLTFQPSSWDTAQTVTVTAVDDAIDNPGNQRTATISHAVSGADYGSVSADSVSITVEDDDDAPTGITLSASPNTVTENGGDQTVTITASTNGGAYATTTTITVEVGKSGDTAVAGSDYTEVDDQTITISAGATSGSVDFTLTPTDDSLDEADESISVTGSVTRDSGIAVTGTAIAITDDDAEPTLSVADATPVTEGHDLTTTDMTFTVSLSEESGRDVTAPYTIESGSTATVGEDYTDPATKSVSIAAGQTSGNIVIEVKGDRVDEDNETIAIKLGDPTNAALSTTTADITASGTITDDDTRGGDGV